MTISPTDFQFVRQMVESDSAIALGEGKEYLVEARLAPLARREGLASVGQLIVRLRAGTPGLRADVVDAITTNETSFFRDVHPFTALREEIIPALLAAGRRPLSIWSAAASTGQEAYSLAMLMRDDFPGEPDPVILGTDLSREVLAIAGAGRYGQLEVNRGLPVTSLLRHFERKGLQWEVSERVRRMVTWRQLNLSRPWPSLPSMDIVFLRNVLIYFESPARSAILDQLARVMRPGAYLFLGSAETIQGDDRYERLTVGRASFYRLRARGSAS